MYPRPSRARGFNLGRSFARAVVALADGRRIYLEYTMDDTASEMVEEIAVEPLAAGMERPDLAEMGYYGIYWYRPDHIAEYLAAQRPGAVRH
jgi:hypothetical protein